VEDYEQRLGFPADRASTNCAEHGITLGEIWELVGSDRRVFVPIGRRPRYLRQVEQIAPPQLEGRDAELTELADFCLDPGRGP